MKKIKIKKIQKKILNLKMHKRSWVLSIHLEGGREQQQRQQQQVWTFAAAAVAAAAWLVFRGQAAPPVPPPRTWTSPAGSQWEAVTPATQVGLALCHFSSDFFFFIYIVIAIFSSG